MKDRMLRGCAVCVFAVPALVAALASVSSAQSWRWTYVTQTPNAPALTAQSAVTLDGRTLRMTYTVPLAKRQVVIESCHASVRDVQTATTIQTQGRNFLLVQFKPGQAAECASGRRPAVALPAEHPGDLTTVIGAINHACCAAPASVARVAAATKADASPLPRPSPAASASAAPSPSPTPRPSPTQAQRSVSAADWVERSGTLSFVRVRNTSAVAVRVRGVDVLACTNVASGCGTSTQDVDVDPNATTTIATVGSSDGARKPAFRYRYTLVHGATTVTRSGSSNSAEPTRFARMSAAEVRSARAAVVGDAASSPSADAGTFAPPRLIKRGSSRLAIGITGTALVRLRIGDTGTPQEATIVTISDRRLAAAAIETAVSSTYAPATQDGRPVAAKYVATFSFDGEDPALATIPVWKRSPLPAPAAASAAPVPVPAQPSPSPSLLRSPPPPPPPIPAPSEVQPTGPQPAPSPS